jgi:hypothetical protein
MLMRMLLLKEGKQSPDTDQRIILSPNSAETLIGRVHRKQKKDQGKFVTPLSSPAPPPQRRSCTAPPERGRDGLVGETMAASATVVTARFNRTGSAGSVYAVTPIAQAALMIAFITGPLQERNKI